MPVSQQAQDALRALSPGLGGPAGAQAAIGAANSLEGTQAGNLISFLQQQLSRLSPELRQQVSAFEGAGLTPELANRVAAELGITPQEAGRMGQLQNAIKYGTVDQFVKESGSSPELAALVQKWSQPQQAAAAAQVDPRIAQQRDTTAQIKDFIARMSAPVVDAQGRITDPILKQLATIGYNGGMNAAGDRGIAGGAASSQAAAMAQQTGLPYLQQRQSLAAQGLGLLNNNTLTSEQLAQNAYGLNLQAQGLNNQLALGQYGQQVQGAQGVGSIIGGGLGALAGGILTGGNPAGIGAGLTAGASIGGGIAGQTIAPPKLGSFKPYSAS